MAFKKGGFGGGHKGGMRFGGPRFDRGGFGGGNARGGKELFDAVCADCGTSCQVPFRPNGKKPVYCKECFPKHAGDEREGRDFAPRAPQRSFGRPEPRRFERPERSFTPAPRPAAPDTRIDALVRDVAALNGKIDALAASIAKVAAPAPVAAAPAAAKKAAKKPAAKKPAAKKKGK